MTFNFTYPIIKKAMPANGRIGVWYNFFVEALMDSCYRFKVAKKRHELNDYKAFVFMTKGFIESLT